MSRSSPPPRISVIIPALNELDRLGATLQEIVAYFVARGDPYEVIVVDDGSRDATSGLAVSWSDRHSAVRLIRLPANRGKGYAVRAGVVNARGSLVLFADADGATPIGEIERLERALDAGADVAIGSRAKRTGEIQVVARWYRHMIGRVFHFLVTRLTVRGFVDTQCGFKLFRAEAAHNLFSSLRMNGFSFDVELLLIAQLRGYRVDEVPVNWTHRPGSRINLVLDSFRMALDLFRIRGNAIRGRYDTPHLRPWSPELADVDLGTPPAAVLDPPPRSSGSD